MFHTTIATSQYKYKKGISVLDKSADIGL